MNRWLWVERTFKLDFPVEKMPDLLERWRGTPARIEERVRGLTVDILTRRDEKGWSIQENIGHLLDLEPLFSERIEQLVRGESELIAADMSNKKTNQANHNDAIIDDLLTTFRHSRFALVNRVESLDESDWEKAALHARTKLPMRMVDVVYFDCEHDDYHLARIGELIKTFVTNEE